MQRPKRIRTLLAASVLLSLSGVAAAQWLMLARKVVGRVEQMQQTAPKTADGADGASYDVATVIVEVAPNKVFDTIQVMLSKNTALKITRTDAAKRSSEFTDGKQIGGIQVNTMGDNLSQLLISTAHPGIATSTTSTIVERVLNVCKELNVQCQLAAS